MLPYDTYNHNAGAVSKQRVINCYAEVQPKSARTPVSLIGTPGIASWTGIGSGPIRGKIEMNDVLYVVSGQDLWSVDDAGLGIIKGSGIAGGDLVGMEQNGFEIVIVNGVNVFSYLLSANTLILVPGAGALAADSVTLLNQHFVLEKKGFNQFFVSAVLDGRSYDVLDFASAESNPDKILAVKAYNGLLYLFGRETAELWNYTGSILFPFSSIGGAVVNRGLGAPKAITAEDSGIFFFGNDNCFYRLGGQREARISTHALEALWQSYEVKDDAFCFSFPHEGHKFIYITFPMANATFGYDLATGRWHERASHDYTDNINRWRATGAVQVYGKVIVGDTNSNRLGIIDRDTYTEFGDPMILRFITPPDYNNGMTISIKSLHLEGQFGVGLSTGQGSDPVAMMRYSTDGGVEWSAEEQASLGLIGDRRNDEAFWTGLGSADQFVIEISISDPIMRVITGIYKNRPRK